MTACIVVESAGRELWSQVPKYVYTFVPVDLLNYSTATFADGQLTDALKQLAADPATNQKVKKKLMAVLASWNAQFKSDPSMTLVANLYKHCRPERERPLSQGAPQIGLDPEGERRRVEKEESKKRAKKEKEDAKEKERLRREEEERRKSRDKNRQKRPPFDFERASYHTFILEKNI